MARIGVDATGVSEQGKGISRVQLRTAQALAAAGAGHDVVVFAASPAAASLLEPSSAEAVVVSHRLMLGWEQLGLPRVYGERRLDVLLTFTERLPVRGGGRYVVWLYELPTHRIAENRRRRAGLYQLASDAVTQVLWKRSLRRAAAVVTGSAATAAELEAALPELRGRVRAIHPGLEDGFSPGSGRGGKRYVLHIGSSDPRDNTETALAAFGLARQRAAEPVRLVVAGALGRRRGAVEAAVSELDLADAVELAGRVSDEELVTLYRGAAAYLDPTLYEGFGYQVLEAMACGAPVVASDTTSIPEVAGGAALLCDPESADELAAALVRVLDEPELAASMRAKGLERARDFTWAQTAEALLEVLEGAAGR
jgi:glycosyltransferase involved in cell wall biosynthesis